MADPRSALPYPTFHAQLKNLQLRTKSKFTTYHTTQIDEPKESGIMAIPQQTLAMQVLADENLTAVIMKNVDDPQVLFNLITVLPVAKVTFERSPRQFVTAAISSLPMEIKRLATLYISLQQHHLVRPAMISTLWLYLRLDDTPGIVVPPVSNAELVIPRLFNPFESLRKLAAVWTAVEDLASGFVERSIQFIHDCNSADTGDIGAMYYEGGHKFRPLYHLWNQEDLLAGVVGNNYPEKLGPWSLPLKTCEIHRIKRALWRLEISAIVSYEPYTFPNEGTMDSADVEMYCVDPIKTSTMPDDYDEGRRMLLASLEASELAELESLYDYLWSAVIKPVYQHKLDSFTIRRDVGSQQADTKHRPVASSSESQQKENNHDDFRTLFLKNIKIDRAKTDLDRYLNYLMSLGLPFFHQIQKQTLRDHGKIIPSNYPPLRYRSLTGLRDTWNDMDRTRHDDIRQSYYNPLSYVSAAGELVHRKRDEWPALEDSSDMISYCAGVLYVRTLDQYHIKDLWRAGCYLWERGGQGCSHSGEEEEEQGAEGEEQGHGA